MKSSPYPKRARDFGWRDSGYIGKKRADWSHQDRRHTAAKAGECVSWTPAQIAALNAQRS